MNIGMTQHFILENIGASDSLSAASGDVTNERRVNLVLRASNSDICLFDGSRLSDIDVYLTLFEKRSYPSQFLSDFDTGDIGYLIQTEGSDGEPLVHGSVLWPDNELPYHLLGTAWRSTIRIEFPLVPMPDPGQTYNWVLGKEHRLRLRFLHIDTTKFKVQ